MGAPAQVPPPQSAPVGGGKKPSTLKRILLGVLDTVAASQGFKTSYDYRRDEERSQMVARQADFEERNLRLREQLLAEAAQGKAEQRVDDTPVPVDTNDPMFKGLPQGVLLSRKEQRELRMEAIKARLRGEPVAERVAGTQAAITARQEDQQKFVAEQAANKVAQVVAKRGQGGGTGTGSKAAVAGGLTPAAIDQAATFYATTGKMPPLGMGQAAVGLRQQIMNRAGELFPGVDLATNQAGFTASSQSLTQVVKMKNAVEAYSNTAGKNLDLFLEQASKVPDTGVPWANLALRTLSEGAVGNANISAYKAARQVALTEIARVVANPNLVGVLSDNARKEISEFNPTSATFNQTKRVAAILKQDMANRHSALVEQEKAIRQGIGIQGGGSGASGGAAPEGTIIKMKDGSTRIKKGGQWVAQ